MQRRSTGSLAMMYCILMMVMMLWVSSAFVTAPSFPTTRASFPLAVETPPAMSTSQTGESDPNEIVARRIIVEGDVQGGYYRSCVLNEAGRFRRLTGTMSPPDDSKTAEIYVEGTRKMVEGFVRWCKKSNVGLSQVVTVTEITEADPTGLYDSFYCKTH